jgi:hypothetical protein
MQVAYQLADSAAGASYAFLATVWLAVFSVTCLTCFPQTLILFVMKRIPGLSLRVDPEVEEVGVDLAEMGDAFDNFDHLADVALRVGALEAGQVRARTVKAWSVEEGVDPTQPEHPMVQNPVTDIPMHAIDSPEASRQYRREVQDY